MSHLLRRLSLSRLLLLCGLVVALGIGATALASALGTGPTPPRKPLAEAIHDALAGAGSEQVQGVTAQVQWTDRLLEGANLASGGGEASQLTKSPLISGASGRLWISKDGHVRLELESEKGDTQIYYDGSTVQMYDASSNTLYRYTPTAQAGGSNCAGLPPGQSCTDGHETPSVTKIEEAISHVREHANVLEAEPADIAGQAAYTVHVSPKETGSLLGGAELSFDAVHGVPLRAAVYSTESSAPALELAVTKISYGPVESSIFQFTPPSTATVDEIKSPEHSGADSSEGGEHPTVTTHGQGLSTIAVLEAKAKSGSSPPSLPEGLQQVKINGVNASELPTELGTLLTFERSGVRYLLAGALPPSAVEAVAKGL